MKKVLSLTVVLAIVLQLVMIAPVSALSDYKVIHAGEQTYSYPTTYDYTFGSQATTFEITDEMLENAAFRIYLRRNSGTLTDLICYIYDGTSVFGVNLLNYVDLSKDGVYGWAVVPLKDFVFNRGGGQAGDKPTGIVRMMLRPNYGTSGDSSNAGTVGLRSVVLQDGYSELNVVEKTTDSITFKWDADENANVTGYKVYCNGIDIATVTEPAYEARNLAPGTYYTFQIFAVKSDGPYPYTKVIKLKTHDLVSETAAEHTWFTANMTAWNASEMITASGRVTSKLKTVASWGNKSIWEHISWNSGWMRAINGGEAYGINSENVDKTAFVISLMSQDISDAKSSAMRVTLQPVNTEGAKYDVGADVVLPGTQELPTGEWAEFVIPLSSMRVPEDFDWSTVGEFAYWWYNHTENTGTGTHVIMDNIRLTSLYPEVRALKFLDEEGNTLFVNEGVLPADTKTVRVHFSRGIDETTLEGVDVTANGVSVVKSRTYDAANHDVTLELNALPSQAELEIKVNADDMETMLLSNKTAGICTLDDLGAPVVDMSQELQTLAASYSYSCTVEEYKVLDKAMFVDGDGYQMGMYFEEANVYAKAEKTSASAEFVIAAAIYDGGVLKDVVTKPVLKADPVGEYKTDVINLTGTMTAKMFVFDSLGTIKPMVDVSESTQIVPWTE